MNSHKKLPKNPFKHNRADGQSFDSVTRAISPISNNEEVWSGIKSRPTDICRSSKVTRNLTPIESIDYKYSIDSLNQPRQNANLTPCENCKRIGRELINCKKSLSSLKERTELNEKHLKQYETLLNIKENRLKDRENLLNKQTDELEAEKTKESSICTKSENRKKQIKGQNRPATENSSSSSNTKKYKNQSSETENFDFKQTEVKLKSSLEEIKLKQTQLAQAETALQRKTEDLENREKKCEENEKTSEKVSKELEKIKADLKVREKNFNDKLGKPCESCLSLQVQIETQREKFEAEIKEMKQASESQLINFEFFKSPQESLINKMGSEIIDSPYKTPEIRFESDEFSDYQMNFSEVTENIGFKRGIIRKVTKLDSRVDSGYHHATAETKILNGESLEFKQEDNYTQKESKVEPSPLFIVTKLKSKLQQKSFEAEQQIKLKELFYQQEKEKFLSKIEQFEKCNQALMKENQEIREKSAQLANEITSLTVRIKEKKNDIEEIQVNNNDLTKKILELTEANQRFEDLTEKLKARVLIYKNKRVSIENPIESEELNTLINSLEEKLIDLETKEAELFTLKRQLISEQENITNNAHCLKILFQDLSSEKLEFLAEKEQFALQKSALLEIERSQQERIELLDVKESELIKFKDELIEKDRILSSHYNKPPQRSIKRMNTQLGVFKNPSTSFE